MDTLQLSAQPRTILGKQVRQLRRQGQLPIILFGHEVGSTPLTVESKNFNKLLESAGTSTLVNLTVGVGESVKVLIHDSQFDPVTGQVIHADLFQVKLSEKLQTDVPLSFVGEAAAVKDLEGNLVTTKDSLRVEAFPQDLVSEIMVDIAALKSFDDKITVADITIPAKIEVLDDPDETVAVVTPPRSEEELEAELTPTTEEAEAAAVAATEEASTEKPQEEEPASL